MLKENKIYKVKNPINNEIPSIGKLNNMMLRSVPYNYSYTHLYAFSTTREFWFWSSKSRSTGIRVCLIKIR